MILVLAVKCVMLMVNVETQLTAPLSVTVEKVRSKSALVSVSAMIL